MFLKMFMLEIKEIPVSRDSHPAAKKPLPNHEFTMALIAPKGAGKTTLLINLLEFYKGLFHQIYIFSPTIKNDEKWKYIKTRKILADNTKLKKALAEIQKKRDVKETKVVKNKATSFAIQSEPPVNKVKPYSPFIPEECFISTFSESSVNDILLQQQEMIAYLEEHDYTKHTADRILLLFDDLVGSNLYSRAQDAPFMVLNTTHRHKSISILMVSQAYKAIPKTIRINFTCMILFRIPNQQELEVIYQEYPMGYSKKEWYSVYEYATTEPHAFLYYNTMFPKNKQVMLSFKKYLNFIKEAKTRISLYEDGEEEEEPVKKRRNV